MFAVNTPNCNVNTNILNCANDVVIEVYTRDDQTVRGKVFLFLYYSHVSAEHVINTHQ